MKLVKLLTLKSGIKDMYQDIESHIMDKGFLLDDDDRKIIATFEDMMELVDEQIGRREYSRAYNRKPKEKQTKNKILMGLWGKK